MITTIEIDKSYKLHDNKVKVLEVTSMTNPVQVIIEDEANQKIKVPYNYFITCAEVIEVPPEPPKFEVSEERLISALQIYSSNYDSISRQLLNFDRLKVEQLSQLQKDTAANQQRLMVLHELFGRVPVEELRIKIRTP